MALDFLGRGLDGRPGHRSRELQEGMSKTRSYMEERQGVCPCTDGTSEV